MAQNTDVVKRSEIETLLDRDDFKKRFNEVLGKRAPAFISSVISAYKATPSLRKCDPASVISAAMVAATLDLPINGNLGFAHIVPYKEKAQFQMGWKGFVQLAIRTGQYRSMNASVVYDGELVSYNRITGEVTFDLTCKKSNKVIGYVAFFKLVNGFEKFLYMTREETEAHGKRYSKSFSSPDGKWRQDFDAMSLKTVVKMLLGKWGILSVELQRALTADQGITEDGETFDYPDVPGKPVISEPRALKSVEDGQDAQEDGPITPEQYKNVEAVAKRVGFDPDDPAFFEWLIDQGCEDGTIMASQHQGILDALLNVKKATGEK